MRTSIAALSFLIALWPAGRLCADEGSFAKNIALQSDRESWENLEQVKTWYCPSIAKSMSKPRILDGWKLGSKYGRIKEVQKVTVEPGYSNTRRTDVIASTTKSEHPVLYRFWIKNEQGNNCLYGYNFAELIR